MKKAVIICSLFICFLSCEENQVEKQKYDIFPLTVGNEFYYDYEKYTYSGIGSYTDGIEIWKVVSELKQEDSITYLIERKKDAVLRFLNDTIIISETNILEVNIEKASSTISVFGFKFKRYQNSSILELKEEGSTQVPGWTYIFKADSGMTKYYYYDPPNIIVKESLILDSLKII